MATAVEPASISIALTTTPSSPNEKKNDDKNYAKEDEEDEEDEDDNANDIETLNYYYDEMKDLAAEIKEILAAARLLSGANKEEVGF